MYLLDHPFFQRWRPAWTLPFVSEQKDLAEVPRSRPTMPPAKTIALFVLSALAFACEVAELIMLRRPDLTPILYTIAWVSSLANSIGGHVYLHDLGNRRASDISQATPLISNFATCVLCIDVDY
jgi:hypothetical protein